MKIANTRTHTHTHIYTYLAGADSGSMFSPKELKCNTDHTILRLINYRFLVQQPTIK